MRESIREAIGDTVRNLIESGVKTSFTEKKLKKFGIEIQEVEIKPKDTK